MSLTDYEMLQNEVAEQQQKIEELEEQIKTIAAYADHRINMLKRASEKLEGKS